MNNKAKLEQEIAECKREIADLRTALYIGSKYGFSEPYLEKELHKLEVKVRRLTREVNHE